MKRILYLFLGFVAFFSCTGRNSISEQVKTHIEAEEEFLSTLTASDTTSVLVLTDKFMSLVKEGFVPEAVDMITVLYEGVVYKPADEYYSELVSRFTHMKIDSYELYKYFFTTEGNNDVCYFARFIPDGSNEPMTIKITFNPIKVNGTWMLSLKDGNQSSKLLPKDKQVHDMAPAPDPVRLNVRQP